MIASPFDSAAATSLTVVSVMWPAGTITQTERGASSFEAMSSSESAATAPSSARSEIASALMS